MSNYYNEAGEPLMDGAAMRYEMYLDSMDDHYDEYPYGYGPDERDDIDPEDCEHHDRDYRNNGCVDCAVCGITIGTWERDSEGWPQMTVSYID